MLDCCFGESGHVAYSGGLDRSVHRTDMAAEADLLLGAHNEAVKCLSYAPELRVAVSGSWDKTVKLWDCRHTECSSSHELPDKVYTMAISGFRLVTGTAGVCAFSCSARVLPTVGVSRLVHRQARMDTRPAQDGRPAAKARIVTEVSSECTTRTDLPSICTRMHTRMQVR